MIPVLKSIEYRGLIEYFNTPEHPAITGGKKVYKHQSDIPLMYFTLYRMYLIAEARTLGSGQHYCHECKGPHYNDQSAQKFVDKYKKSMPFLQRIHKEKLY